MDNLSKEAELALGPELAREIDSFIWSHKVTGNAEVRAMRLVKQLVDIAALAQHPATTDNWIRVEDKLPEGLGRVLVRIKQRGQDQQLFDYICGAEYTPGRFTDITWRTDEGEWYSGVQVTHWQPLPTPPTQATRKEGSHE